MKKVLKFVVLISWPIVILVGIILWKKPNWKEKEVKERKELLSDTAKVNAAHRTYEKVKLQQILEDSNAVELAKKVLEIKGEKKGSLRK